MVHSSYIENVIDFKPFSHRIAVLQVKGNNRTKNKLQIVQVYFPTTTYSDEDVWEATGAIQAAIFCKDVGKTKDIQEKRRKFVGNNALDIQHWNISYNNHCKGLC